MVLRSLHPDVIVPDVSFHDHILKSLYERGDRIAIIDAPTGRQFTCKRIADEVVKCASALNGAGLRKGDVVATCASNSPELIIVTIAAAACGGITTTCNPNSTILELRHQFESSEPKFVFTIPEQYKKIVELAKIAKSVSKIYVISGESYSTLLKNETNAEFPRVSINPEEDLFLLPYSSGTTGFPKGVMITHRHGVCSLLVGRVVALYPSDCTYTPLPIFHMLGLVSVFCSLDQGVKNVLETRFNLERLFSDIEKYKITQVVGVPPIFHAMINSPLIDKYDLSSVRSVLCGAGSLPPKILKEVEKKFKCRVIQCWGMTEAAPITKFNVLVSPPQSIGEVGINCRIKVIDIETGEELGPYQNGELCVKGQQVTKGYYKNPVATAAALSSDGWFHSGDMGYYDDDQMIYIVGRLKELIKYKGFQVPPVEVESVLVTHPGIYDAAVIGVPDAQAGELARGFIVRKDDSLTENDVHEFLKDKLSKYKHLHGGIEFCKTIPRSPAGKILRNKLKKRIVKAKL